MLHVHCVHILVPTQLHPGPLQGDDDDDDDDNDDDDDDDDNDDNDDPDPLQAGVLSPGSRGEERPESNSRRGNKFISCCIHLLCNI